MERNARVEETYLLEVECDEKDGTRYCDRCRFDQLATAQEYAFNWRKQCEEMGRRNVVTMITRTTTISEVVSYFA